MISGVFSRIAILTFGTLYPAYASFKAVRAKNVAEYVKWMMYWIVFAIFSCIETFTDLFLPWLPFYYEIKVVLVLWLLSPATNGSSILYRKFVHPLLKRKEPEIDGYIVRMRERGYATIMQLGTRIFNHVRKFVLDALHHNFTSFGTLHENVMRPSASDGRVNGQLFDDVLPRSRSMQTKRKPSIIITEESGSEECEMPDIKQQLSEYKETASGKTQPTASTSRGRKGKAANQNVPILRRGRPRTAKEAANDFISDEDELQF